MKYVGLARALRKWNTDAEAALWRKLRARQLSGLKFRRQHPFRNYILDFYCEELLLVVELDGDQHGMAEGEAKDAKRTEDLNHCGMTVLRHSNVDVLKNVDGVLMDIDEARQKLQQAGQE
jgi:very-short-patch-repair endonuclease